MSIAIHPIIADANANSTKVALLRKNKKILSKNSLAADQYAHSEPNKAKIPPPNQLRKKAL